MEWMLGVLIRARSALHANVKSKRVTIPALGPESMFSNFSLASHVEINLCSSQGHAFWESLVQSNSPESLDQSHWSPFSTCRIEGAGSRELCKRLLCVCLTRPPASDAELLSLVQVGTGQAQVKHRPESPEEKADEHYHR